MLHSRIPATYLARKVGIMTTLNSLPLKLLIWQALVLCRQDFKGNSRLRIGPRGTTALDASVRFHSSAIEAAIWSSNLRVYPMRLITVVRHCACLYTAYTFPALKGLIAGSTGNENPNTRHHVPAISATLI